MNRNIIFTLTLLKHEIKTKKTYSCISFLVDILHLYFCLPYMCARPRKRRSALNIRWKSIVVFLITVDERVESS